MIENTNNHNFWKTGNGKDFIQWSGIDVSAGEFNTNLFYSYDQKVDKLVQQWLANNSFKSIMQYLHNGKETNLPDNFIKLKSDLEQVPHWVDKKLIQAGCELSQRSGLIGLLVLRNFALLGGYNFANLTKPLVATGALEKGAVNRLTYTLDFWVNVSRTNQDSQNKRINACLRTRLVHSASRLMILEKHSNWNSEKYGTPINYADMIATNTAFTVYYLYGLSQLNFKYTELEEKGIFHLWKYITYSLGVPSNLIPNNKKEALRFFKFWTQYQQKADRDALKLTTALLQENTPISLLKLDIVKRNMGYIHKSIANYLIDDNIKKQLEIPKVRFKNIIVSALKVKNEIPVKREEQIKKGNAEQWSVLKDYKTHA